MDASTRLEAMRIAKLIVRDKIRKRGVKLNSVAAQSITTAAKLLLKHDKHGPGIERMAKRIMKIRSENVRALLKPSGPQDFLNDDELRAYAKKVVKESST